MSARFPLAGLLRLRQLEQDRAAGRLGSATARRAKLAATESRAAAEAERIASEADSSAALRAIAAARASSVSMLGELRGLAAGAEAEAAEAELAFGAARARTVGLEKLEARHGAEQEAAALAAEQAVLDELGSTAWHRGGAGGAGVLP